MISLKAQNLKPSPTLALVAKAKELKSQGKDVISLSVGEPDWDTEKKIKKVGISAIEQGFTKYTPVNGIPELKQAISEQIKKDLNLSYENNEIVVSPGAKFAIYSALQMICNKDDQVIVPSPYWVSYPEMVTLSDAIPQIITCKQDTNFKITSDLLKTHINKKTKAIILNSPSNPTGEVYSENELKEISKVLLEHPDIYIISDDIYNYLVFPPYQIAPHILQICPELKNRTIIINGASKTYAMTGWRIGWGIGPKHIISSMGNFQSQAMGCSTSISQKACVEAITNCAQNIKEFISLLLERKKYAIERINKIKDIKSNDPQGAFYIWLDISNLINKKYQTQLISSSKDFCQLFLDKHYVTLVPGIEFGLEGYARISYALNKDTMGKAIDRLEEFINNCK